MPLTNDSIQTILGFDFGLRRIGIAVGQSVTGTATPLHVVPAKAGQPNWSFIGDLIDGWQPTQLLVGLPLNMDGTASELSQRAEKFARRLHGRFGIRVDTIDERLSSREAQALDSHQNQPIDALAAVVIIETWLHQHERKDD